MSVLAVDGVISALWAVEDELRPETIEVVKRITVSRHRCMDAYR